MPEKIHPYHTKQELGVLDSDQNISSEYITHAIKDYYDFVSANAGDIPYEIAFRFTASVRQMCTMGLGRYLDPLTQEDVGQEATLKIHFGLGNYEPQENVPPAAWAYRIVQNQIINHLRKNGSLEREISQTDISEYDGHTLDRIFKSMQISPEEELIQKDNVSGVMNALSAIKLDYQEVLFHRYLEGLSPEETAEIMGRSNGAARVLTHRALRQLASFLTEQGFKLPTNNHGISQIKKTI